MSDPEAQPMMNGMMDDDDQQMDMQMVDAEKAEPEKQSVKSDPIVDEVKKRLDDGAFMCCCCLCECTDSKTKQLSCCCFFPIKCGVYVIGGLILAVTLFAFLEVFYQLLNDDIHWWYVFVAVLLCSLLVIASSFVVVFFTKDQKSSRSKLKWGCLFVIIGISLLALWSACYFLFWYKKENVVTGNDGVGFLRTTRKQQIVITLYVACLVDAVFAYFMCVVAAYGKAYDGEGEEEEEVKAMSEKAASEKMMSEKMASEKPEEAGADGMGEPPADNMDPPADGGGEGGDM